MPVQRGTFSGTFAADAYRNLMDLFALGQAKADVVGGLLQAQTNAAVVRIVPRGSPAPATGDAGILLAASSGIGLQLTDQWRLDEVWVRNATAGSNATMVYTGTLEV